MAGGSSGSRAQRLLRAVAGLFLSLSAAAPVERRRVGPPESGLAVASALLTLGAVEIGARSTPGSLPAGCTAPSRFLDDLRFLPATGLSVPGPSAPRPWWIEVTLRDWSPELNEGFDLPGDGLRTGQGSPHHAGALRGERLREVDVTDALRRDPRPEELYYRYDGHLQPHGAGVVARTLAETLVEDALVPR